MTISELLDKYSEERNAIETILNMTDSSQGIAIVLAIDKAYKSILKYTGWSTFDSGYISAVYSLAIAYYNNDLIKYKLGNGKRLVTQQTQGSRSVTYGNESIALDEYGLTAEVKAMLPLPKLKVL